MRPSFRRIPSAAKTSSQPPSAFCTSGMNAVLKDISAPTSLAAAASFSLQSSPSRCRSSARGAGAWARVPRLIDLYRAGRLKLDELITRRYPLAKVNDAFTAMKEGEVTRGVVQFSI